MTSKARYLAWMSYFQVEPPLILGKTWRPKEAFFLNKIGWKAFTNESIKNWIFLKMQSVMVESRSWHQSQNRKVMLILYIIYILSLDAHLYIFSVHWCMCLIGQFSRTKNLADWDEGLFTRMGHYLFLSKVVLIPSGKQKNDRGYVKYMI